MFAEFCGKHHEPMFWMDILSINSWTVIDSEEKELEMNLAVRSLRLEDTDHLSGAGPG